MRIAASSSSAVKPRNSSIIGAYLSGMREDRLGALAHVNERAYVRQPNRELHTACRVRVASVELVDSEVPSAQWLPCSIHKCS